MRIITKTIIAISIISLLSISLLVISIPKDALGPVIVKLKKVNNTNASYNESYNESIEEPVNETIGNWTEWSPPWRFIYEDMSK